MLYFIFCKYKGQQKEVIDTAEDLKTANYLINEYEIAFKNEPSRIWKRKMSPLEQKEYENE